MIILIVLQLAFIIHELNNVRNYYLSHGCLPAIWAQIMVCSRLKCLFLFLVGHTVANMTDDDDMPFSVLACPGPKATGPRSITTVVARSTQQRLMSSSSGELASSTVALTPKPKDNIVDDDTITWWAMRRKRFGISHVFATKRNVALAFVGAIA